MRTALLLLLLLAGCSTSSSFPQRGEQFYWDKPHTEWFWVPKGTEGSTIIDVAASCGTKIDGSVANHGIVPPGYDFVIFKFLEPASEAARECTVTRLRAVPALTVYVHER